MVRRSTQFLTASALGLFVAVTTFGASAFAQHEPAAAVDGHEAPAAAADRHEAPAAAAAEGHIAVAHEPAAAEGHAASGHGKAEGHAPPTIADINWYYGFFGEKVGATPSFAVRPKGMGTPFLATLLNWGILVALIVVVAKKQVPLALAKRKASIVQGMDDAAKMLADSRARLDELEQKLSKIDSEIERIKSEMARAGEIERERILEEAVERRVRMERDARRLIETELDATRESLRRFVVEQAIANARSSIQSQVKVADQQRMFDEALGQLRQLPARSLGEHS